MKKTKIPTKINFQGFVYELVEQIKNVVIYSQHSDDGFPPSNYEVFFVGTFFRMPQDEAFGVTAWTYKTLEDAKSRVKRLTNA